MSATKALFILGTPDVCQKCSGPLTAWFIWKNNPKDRGEWRRTAQNEFDAPFFWCNKCQTHDQKSHERYKTYLTFQYSERVKAARGESKTEPKPAEKKVMESKTTTKPSGAKTTPPKAMLDLCLSLAERCKRLKETNIRLHSEKRLLEKENDDAFVALYLATEENKSLKSLVKSLSKKASEKKSEPTSAKKEEAPAAPCANKDKGCKEGAHPNTNGVCKKCYLLACEAKAKEREEKERRDRAEQFKSSAAQTALQEFLGSSGVCCMDGCFSPSLSDSAFCAKCVKDYPTEKAMAAAAAEHDPPIHTILCREASCSNEHIPNSVYCQDHQIPKPKQEPKKQEPVAACYMVSADGVQTINNNPPLAEQASSMTHAPFPSASMP